MNDEYAFNDFLDEKFQILVIALLSRDRDFLARARHIVKVGYFRGEVYRMIVQSIFDYWDTYRTVPPPESLLISVSEKAETAETREAWVAALDRVVAIAGEDIDRPFLETTLVHFAQRAEFALAITGTYNAVKEGPVPIEPHLREVERIMRLSATFLDLGDSVRKTWTTVLDPDEREPFLTGLRTLDQSMAGGAREGDLVVFVAPLKVGKSMILGNCATGLCWSGHNVVIYSLELYAPKVKARILANLSHSPTNKIREYSDRIAVTMEALGQVTSADIVIKYFPGDTITVGELESHLYLLEGDYGSIVPVIDYADYLRPETPFREEWRGLVQIYLQLRNLGFHHHVPVFTASQTDTAGMTAESLGPQHTGGSKRKLMIADYGWFAEQSPTDRAVRRMKLVGGVNRNDAPSVPIFIKHDFAEARMWEITHQEYEALTGGMEPPKQGGRGPRSTFTEKVMS